MPDKGGSVPVGSIERMMKAHLPEGTRIGQDGLDRMCSLVNRFVEEKTKEAWKLASHAGRKTIKEQDIE